MRSMRPVGQSSLQPHALPGAQHWSSSMKFTDRLVPLAMALATVSTAASAEPPVLEVLACTVGRMEVGDTIRLRVRFENHGDTPLELPPGPHLIFYIDAAATQRLDLVARMDRIQRAPIVVPSAGSTEELFAMSKAPIASLGCAGAKPAAAAMYFYKFSQQPQFRCVLHNFDFQSAAGSPACPPVDAPGQNRNAAEPAPRLNP